MTITLVFPCIMNILPRPSFHYSVSKIELSSLSLLQQFIYTTRLQLTKLYYSHLHAGPTSLDRSNLEACCLDLLCFP